MNKSPLVDVLAILICLLAVVVLGQYYIHKKDMENNSLQEVEKRVELKTDKKDMSKFESAVKITN